MVGSALASRRPRSVASHQRVLIAAMSYVNVGMLVVLCRPGTEVYSTLGLALSIMSIYSLFALSRIHMKSALLLALATMFALRIFPNVVFDLFEIEQRFFDASTAEKRELQGVRRVQFVEEETY